MVGKGYASSLTILAAGALGIGLFTAAMAAANVVSHAARAGQVPRTESCVLGPSGSIKHVIYMQFDNTHYSRDNPNVPSDLEQMPNLLNFWPAGGGTGWWPAGSHM